MVSVPLFFNNKRTVKSNVVEVLLEKNKLRKMEIFREIKKRGNNITFHAVNKSVNELSEIDVLKKYEREYGVNPEWINQLHDFTEKARVKFLDENGSVLYGIKDIKREGGITTITFDNIYDMDKYYKGLHEYYYSKLKDDEIVCLTYDHQWWHILYPQQDYELNEANKKFYCVSTNNTSLDIAGINFKRLLGMNVVIRKQGIQFRNTSVYGAVVIQTIIGKNLNDSLDNYFSKTKTIQHLSASKRFVDEVLKKKGKVILIINQNADLAEEVRNHVLGCFS
ncbi:MAG: hypothetical protein V1645_02560 [archaeon]